jgi:hypothetical protein
VKRVALIIFLVCFALAVMTACGQSPDDLKRDAEFVKVCKDNGGHILYDMFNGMHCSFEEAP